ncbi:MAG: N-acetylmuramoyl-L-alanine amidase [Planctomycetes bacterium]|nr:N-acetylmuramoyl-L-alanine amidase [Planctomycetota bacterium]
MPPPPIPRRRLLAPLVAVALLLLVRCAHAPAAPRAFGTLWICDTAQPIAANVVTFRDAGGYDAGRGVPWLAAEPPRAGQASHSARRGLPDRATLADLQRHVHQFVLHYDATGTSRQCFKVLQSRNLSVHFLLDVDGTIYQTLDLREKAHHATIANDGSIGVEIAHPGAWPQPMNADMRRWYEADADGWRMRFPNWIEHGVATPGFTARPARPEIVAGTVNGRVWHQLDFTEAQYRSLAALCAALAAVFPRLRLEAPRDQQGRIVDHALPPEQLRAFDGIVGHFHVQADKQDPGPAFQWERVLAEARALR